MQPHIITDTGCFTVFCRQSGWYSSPDLCQTKLLPSLWNKLNCDSSDHITFFHRSMVQSLWSLAHWSLAVIIFCSKKIVFSWVFSWQRHLLMREADTLTPLKMRSALSSADKFCQFLWTSFTNVHSSLFWSFLGLPLFFFGDAVPPFDNLFTILSTVCQFLDTYCVISTFERPISFKTWIFPMQWGDAYAPGILSKFS